MSDARTRILGRLRKALQHDEIGSATADEAYRALTGEARAPRPTWSGSTERQFLRKLEAAAASWDRIESSDDLPMAVNAFLDKVGLGKELSRADHPLLSSLDWGPEWNFPSGRPEPQGSVSLSVAYAGIAETGTLVMRSDPGTPTLLNFLPEFHVVALRRADIVPYMEDAWQLLRAEREFPPRMVNLITGPSRTGDVEQTIQLGAHGPRQLHVIVFGMGR